MRALIIEDDPASAALSRSVVEDGGFSVDVIGTAAEAFEAIRDDGYMLIVLDLGLPDGNGVAIVEALRRHGRTTPVMVLTGSVDTETTVRALDAGADDYVTKPVVPEALRARLRALMRRAAQRPGVLTRGNIVFDRMTRRVVVGDSEVALTMKELALLEQLLLSGNEVLSRALLLERVWDMHFDPGSNMVDVTVTRLRRKLNDAHSTVRIASRRGVGFVLSEDGDTVA